MFLSLAYSFHLEYIAILVEPTYIEGKSVTSDNKDKEKEGLSPLTVCVKFWLLKGKTKLSNFNFLFNFVSFNFVWVTGFEPVSPAWKADYLTN